MGKNRYCVDMSLRVDQYRSHHNGKLIRLQNCHSGMNEILTINRFELSSQFITNKAGENVYAIKKNIPYTFSKFEMLLLCLASL